jgi:signal transduction histidine kinase
MKGIACSVEIEGDLPPILGDEQGLQQVFSNLLINAVDALEGEEKAQPVIKIKAYTSGGKVFAEIEDNGCGIPEEIKRSIFDPFFTTKSPDRGTGLGMPIVESILHKHQARIWMESQVGVGTKFTLVFPVPPPGTMPNPSDPAKQ